MKSDISGQKQKKKSKKKVNIKWIITIFLSTVVISAVFSTISNMLLGQAGLVPAFFILLVIVLIGILFDIIGVAVTAADVTPCHSMAAHRVPGAQEALKLLRNAEKVSSFCNDVVGDICGIISGTASASIVLLILANRQSVGTRAQLLEIGMAAVVSGLTVGGKAVGKTFAMTKSTSIVHCASKVIYYIKSAPSQLKKLLGKRKN